MRTKIEFKNEYIYQTLKFKDLYESRKQIAERIVKSIRQNQSKIQQQYKQTEKEIGYFFVDDLLPKELAQKIYNSFPKVENTVQKKNLRE